MATNTSRKIFNYENITENKIISSLSDKKNLYTNSISACGCLFYKKVNNTIQLLLISYIDPGWPKLDDLGGRIDESDKSVFDAIAREASEETNHVISEEFMKNLLSDENNFLFFYNRESKYYTTLVEVDDTFYNDTNVFGDFETHDKIPRTIGWYNYTKIKSKLAMRLLCSLDLIEHLDHLSQVCPYR